MPKPRTRWSLRMHAISRKVAIHVQGVATHVESRIFDRLMGVSTGKAVYAEDSLITTGGDNLGYESCGWRAVWRVLKDLNPGPADVFVDLGSGKGRPLLIAGQLPFRRAIGIELDEELSHCARRNVVRARPRLRVPEIDTVTTNVLDWPIPDDTSVFFFYNPFVGETFRTVVDRIFESYDRRPRTLHIIYAVPWEHNWLMDTGRVVVDNVRPGRRPAFHSWGRLGNVIVSYRVVGALARSRSEPGPPPWMYGRRQAFRIWNGPNDFCFAVSQPGHRTVFSRP